MVFPLMRRRPPRPTPFPLPDALPSVAAWCPYRGWAEARLRLKRLERGSSSPKVVVSCMLMHPCIAGPNYSFVACRKARLARSAPWSAAAMLPLLPREPCSRPCVKRRSHRRTVKPRGFRGCMVSLPRLGRSTASADKAGAWLQQSEGCRFVHADAPLHRRAKLQLRNASQGPA